MENMDDILKAVDNATEPDKMGPGEALEFLDRLAAAIETRIDGIKDDMRAKGQEWA